MAAMTTSVRSFTTSVDIPAASRTKVVRILNQHLADSPMPIPPTLLTTVGARRPVRARPTDGGRILGRAPVADAPLAVCFPRDDPRFAERVQRLVDASGPHGPITAAVQALLREAYPLAVVSPRHELAAIDGGRVWYAFREGSLVPMTDGDTS